MKTEDFINTLAVDRTVGAAPGRMLALALTAGTAIGAIVFMLMLGVRDDFEAALQTMRFPFKFVVTIALAIAGMGLVSALDRPGGDAGAAARLLAVPFLLIAAGVLVELAVVPAGDWLPRLIGHNAAICLTAIPVIAVAPLMAVLIALRHAAPTAPVRAGTAAGLVAAAIAATLYASHCVDDSPLFVAIWYTLATTLVAAAGAWLGPRMLRW